MEIRPFRIEVEQRVLEDLEVRLRRARWPRHPIEAGWTRGASLHYLHDFLGYWRTAYDWRRREAELNAWPHLKAHVGDLDVHFLHFKGRGPDPLPLLLLHGWPDSFLRFRNVVKALSDLGPSGADPADSFEVIVPSLPGFGFTGPARIDPHQPNRQSAQILWRLMTEGLGHTRFAVAGGDGGSVLAQIMAIDHPESIVGVHLTDLGWHATNVDPLTLPKAEQKYLEGVTKRFMADGAYAMVQTTRPRSLSAALNDSPLGLAAWIIDRFHAWSGSGDLDEHFGKDELLDNIMIYWVTQTIGSSMYSYYAEAKSPSLTPDDRVERPVGLALFPQDIGGVPPRSFAERTLNVERYTVMPRGGHFAALEEPELYRREVVEFFRSLRAHRDTSRSVHVA